MVFLLFVTAIFMLMLGYFVVEGNLISPIIVSSLVVAIAAFVGLIFESSWNLCLHYESVKIIILGLLFIFLGNYAAIRYGNYFNVINLSVKGKYVLKNKFLFFYGVFVAFLLYQFYININYFILSLSDVYLESTDVLLKVREAKLESEFDEPLGLKIATSLNNCFFIVSCYCVVYNMVFKSLNKSDCKFIIPIIVYTITSVLNASRIDFLGPFFFIISLSVTMLSLKKTPNEVVKKFICYGGPASFLFLGWFALLRYFRGGDFNVFDHLARYISGGLYCLDKYCEGEVYPYLHSNDFGAHTFVSIYKILEQLGYYTDISNRMNFASFVALSNFECNIYTAFAPLVEDFGIYGCSFILMVISFIMGAYQQYISKKKIMGICLIIFAETMSIFFMLCVDEQLFKAHFIPVSRIAHFVLVYLFLSFVEKWRLE